MKFKALRNVSLGIGKTGKITYATKDEVIDLDDINLINDLIMNFAITPADDSLVPSTALYKVQHGFNETFEGKAIKANAGVQLTLSRDIAVRLMAKGYIVPENDQKWYPAKPSYRREGEAKRMYDSDAETQEGWITSWKEGRQ